MDVYEWICTPTRNEWRFEKSTQPSLHATLAPSPPVHPEPLKATMSALTPVTAMAIAKRAVVMPVKRMVCS